MYTCSPDRALNSQGYQGNAGSFYPSVSSEARYVAFESGASNLVGDDVNFYADVFVHDSQTGQTTRVSVDSQGNEGNWSSHSASIAADGRYVAFASEASNLVAGDTNETTDVFVHDLQTGVTTRVSVDSSANESNGPSSTPSISMDGRYVAFTSEGDNLVSGDTNGYEDVFVRDRQTGATMRVSIDSNGNEAHERSNFPAISADGRMVAFGSAASDLVPGDTNNAIDVFVHDCQTGETTRVSVDSQGNQANSQSWLPPSVSGDGRFVAFASRATNLVTGDTNGYNDVFVHDLQTDETVRVSVGSSGSQANSGESEQPSMSSDGRFVAFHSWAMDLVPGDTNGRFDVFVHDLLSRSTVRVSLDSHASQGDRDSRFPSISDDGRIVTFESEATNLVSGDTNAGEDIFVRDTASCESPAASANYGTGWPGTDGVPGLVATSAPVLCNPVGVFADSSYGILTVGVFIVGLSDGDVPTAWGGTLLVVPMLASSVVIPGAGFSVGAAVPCDMSLCGVSIFLQVLEVDPGASRGVSFTPGLKLSLGGS